MTVIQEIMSIALSMMIGFVRMIVKAKDMAMKVMGTMAVTLYLTDGASKTMLSTWNGPVGGMMRTLCFHPTTRVKMIDNTYKYMKDIDIGDILHNNSNVIATMKIKGGRANPFYKIYSETLEDVILITGEHKIQDKLTGRFIPVSDFSGAEKTNIFSDKMTCLITDDHLIPIGEYIFWDWED